MADTALKMVVDQTIEKAQMLTELSSADEEQSQEESTIADHSYEDLLATAILNKVI